MGRQRQRIIGETAFSKISQGSSGGSGSSMEMKDKSLFITEANESKHVWYVHLLLAKNPVFFVGG